MKHKWDNKDETIAFLLFKIGNPTSKQLDEISAIIGCPKGSLIKRIQNFQYVAHKTGKMSHASRRTKDIYNKLK